LDAGQLARQQRSNGERRRWNSMARGKKKKEEVGSGCAYLGGDAQDEVEGEASCAGVSQLATACA
jgi:hypothetical protein